MHDFAFIFAGFFVGLVVGLTGVGGGSLMTPILIFFFGVKPYMAVGTAPLESAAVIWCRHWHTGHADVRRRWRDRGHRTDDFVPHVAPTPRCGG